MSLLPLIARSWAAQLVSHTRQVSSMHGVGRLRCSDICDFEWQLRVADFRAVEVACGSKRDRRTFKFGGWQQSLVPPAPMRSFTFDGLGQVPLVATVCFQAIWQWSHQVNRGVRCKSSVATQCSRRAHVGRPSTLPAAAAHTKRRRARPRGVSGQLALSQTSRRPASRMTAIPHAPALRQAALAVVAVRRTCPRQWAAASNLI